MWNAVITNAGKALLATWVTGTTFTFNSAAGGTGTVPLAALMAQTALANKKQDYSILAGEKVTDGVKLKIQVVAPTIGYKLNQIEVRGSVNGGNPAMVAIFQNDEGISIPSRADTPDFIYNFYGTLVMSNTGTFTLTIDPSATVSRSTLDEAMAAKQNKITATGILKSDGAGGVSAAVAGNDFGYPMKSGTSNPTSTTVGTVGQHYFNTTTGEEFVCSAASGGTYTWKKAGASDAADLTYNGGSLKTALDELSEAVGDSQPGTLKGATDPTTSTVGEVGQFYMNTVSGNLFVCQAVSGSICTWKSAGSEPVYPQITATVSSGAVVTCTKGTTTLTKTSNGTVTFDIPSYGNWTVQATLSGKSSNSEVMMVDAVKQYAVPLSFFSATLTVTAETGATVTATDGTRTYSGSCDTNGKCALTIMFAGTYTIKAVKNNATSSTATSNVATTGSSYTATVTFITLTITIDSGSAVSATDGTTTVTGTSTGSVKLYLPNTGTWSATATLSGETASGSVVATAYTGYTLALSYVKVFGVMWNYANTSTALTRLTKANDPNALVTVNITVEPVAAVGTGAGSSQFDSYAPWSGMTEYNIINNAVSYAKGAAGFLRSNDTVVMIPTYYFRIVDDAASSKRYYYVADKAKSGFTKHPGSGRYVGKYHTGTGYVSKSGIAPLTNLTRATARTNSASKGANWWQYDVATWNAIQLLYLVEFADWNSQTKIGRGYVDGSAAVNNGGCDSMTYHTGRASGTDGLTAVQYRWIESLWGNVYDWIDGINEYGTTFYICTNPANFADSTSANHTTAGFVLPGASGYQTKHGYDSNLSWLMFCSAVGGSDSTYIPDYSYSYSAAAWYVVCVGGYYSNASDAGLFCANYGSVTGAGALIGARLLFVP